MLCCANIIPVSQYNKNIKRDPNGLDTHLESTESYIEDDNTFKPHWDFKDFPTYFEKQLLELRIPNHLFNLTISLDLYFQN